MHTNERMHNYYSTAYLQPDKHVPAASKPISHFLTRILVSFDIGACLSYLRTAKCAPTVLVPSLMPSLVLALLMLPPKLAARLHVASV